MFELVDYQIVKRQATDPTTSSQMFDQLPHLPEGQLYGVRVVESGIFRHARRQGLEAFVPVVDCNLPGLAAIEPFIELQYPRVPWAALQTMLNAARSTKGPEGQPVEILFHLVFNEAAGRWKVAVPEQDRGPTHVIPVRSGVAPGSTYEQAIIEVHSHHNFDPTFSRTDDKEETGFRLYAVLGDIFENPAIRLRVGVYGVHYEWPASLAFEIMLGPDGRPMIEDCEAAEWDLMDHRLKSF